MDETLIDDGRIELGKPKAFHIQSDEVETISKDELYELLRRHEHVQLINVLSPELYSLGSIKTSLRIPVFELENRLMEIDKSKEIITYCANYDCEKSKLAAAILNSHGFCARAYEGGIEEWKRAGLAVDR
jgi:rhodanese-related sulfurtransferase